MDPMHGSFNSIHCACEAPFDRSAWQQDTDMETRAKIFSAKQTLDQQRAKIFSAKQIRDLSSMNPAERAKTFSQNEAILKSFYLSGEPESTLNYKFIEVYRPCTVKISGMQGLGLFLNERAVPGQLLIVDNAIASCSSIPAGTMPHKPGSCLHSLDALTRITPFPRIPANVHEQLTKLLIQYCDSCDIDDRRKVFNLDNLSISYNGRSKDTHPLGNVVTYNAMCDRVRSVSQDEPRRVETSDLWGVWLVPSFINHSCAPNCHRMRVGEAMIIRAATAIEAGDELTLPYFDIFEPHCIRRANCLAFGFRCNCPRCTFEGFIGKSYDELQTRIVELKIDMQAEWKMNQGTGGGGNAKRQLKELINLIDPIIDIIDDMLYESQDAVEVGWIRASFIDADIAAYAMAVTDLGVYPSDGTLSVATKTYLRAKRSGQRLIDTVTDIVDIINEVHPGNMLGQEFYSILLKVCRTLSAVEPRAQRAAKYTFQLQSVERSAMRFFSSYYGYPGTEVLKMLLATES